MYKWGDESHMAIYPAVLIRAAIGFQGRVDDLSSQRCLSKSGSKFVASGASTVAWGGTPWSAHSQMDGLGSMVT